MFQSPGTFNVGDLAEVVLQQPFAASLRSTVEKEAVLSDLAMEVVEAAIVRVDDIVPVSVEALRGAMIGVDQDRRGQTAPALPIRTSS